MSMHFMKIVPLYSQKSHLLTLKAHITKSHVLLSSAKIFLNYLPIVCMKMPGCFLVVE